jgi:hypothetical protein
VRSRGRARACRIESLDAGKDQEARAEIERALPVIDEYKLMPEGIAALSLLRQSLANRRINQKALRDLHGFFSEP